MLGRSVYEGLGLRTCDILIIQFPPPVAGEDFPLDKMKDVWKVCVVGSSLSLCRDAPRPPPTGGGGSGTEGCGPCGGDC